MAIATKILLIHFFALPSRNRTFNSLENVSSSLPLIDVHFTGAVTYL
jgi:hypothetical protein